EHESSAKVLRINLSSWTAALVARYSHSPPLLADVEGSVQLLGNHNVFVGWGDQPDFSEYTSSGRQIFNGSFVAPVNSYRAYRFPWTAQPVTRPSVAVVRRSNGTVNVYASWNGATDVAAWRILGGPAPGSLRPLGHAAKRGFETAVKLHTRSRYYAVEALNRRGEVLRRSRVVARPR